MQSFAVNFCIVGSQGVSKQLFWDHTEHFQSAFQQASLHQIHMKVTSVIFLLIKLIVVMAISISQKIHYSKLESKNDDWCNFLSFRLREDL